MAGGILLIPLGVILALVLVEGVAILALARAIGLMQVRLGSEPAALQTSDGPDLESHVPALAGYDLRSRRDIRINSLPGRWGLLFVSVTCGVCRQLVRDAATVRGWGARLVIISEGSNEQNEVFHQVAPDLMLLSDASGALQKLYDIERTPFGLLVQDDRVMAKGVINNRDHLEALLEGRTTRRPDRAWAPVGATPALRSIPGAVADQGSGDQVAHREEVDDRLQ